jgi:hypothetical protein
MKGILLLLLHNKRRTVHLYGRPGSSGSRFLWRELFKHNDDIFVVVRSLELFSNELKSSYSRLAAPCMLTSLCLDARKIILANMSYVFLLGNIPVW